MDLQQSPVLCRAPKNIHFPANCMCHCASHFHLAAGQWGHMFPGLQAEELQLIRDMVTKFQHMLAVWGPATRGAGRDTGRAGWPHPNDASHALCPSVGLCSISAAVFPAGSACTHRVLPPPTNRLLDAYFCTASYPRDKASVLFAVCDPMYNQTLTGFCNAFVMDKRGCAMPRLYIACCLQHCAELRSTLNGGDVTWLFL